MLYFVATPIGNLLDISYRAIEVLKEVDIIACEDTRNSIKLLNHYSIKKKLIAHHKFNETNSSNGIIELLKQGKSVAVISDGGMPVISDPGNILCKMLNENKIKYTVIPGANAALCALVLSGFNASRFNFIGFLPEQNKDIKNILTEAKSYNSTLIFYVAPHNVIKDTKIIASYLGNRKACLVGEITKMHEKTLHFCLNQLTETNFRGEYVLIVEGNKLQQDSDNLTLQQELMLYLSQGLSKNDAVKQVAKNRNIKKNDVYQIAINLENSNK